MEFKPRITAMNEANASIDTRPLRRHATTQNATNGAAKFPSMPVHSPAIVKTNNPTKSKRLFRERSASR